MKVLSLFDGMSCGQIALKQLGVILDVYYASEIDKYAISQTQLNFPDTVQLGDVTKWREWNIDWKSLDLILAGSPCQGFSFSGKQLAFDDPRSKLFFVFIDILNHVRSFNPNVLFLLENVNMKKSYMRVISEYCGVFPVNINSNLVSAQNRNRWYWTNIRTKQVGLFGELHSDIPQPADKGILLRDVLEEVVDEKYYVSQAVIDRMNKPHECFTPQINPSKAGCLTTKNNSGQMSFDSGTTFISISLNKSTPMGSAMGMGGGHVPMITSEELQCKTDIRLRRLTPVECSRLQTIPFWYQWKCSDTQIYKMLGNGWTVDVIAHILSFMNIDNNDIKN